MKLPGQLDVAFVRLLQGDVELFVVVCPHGVDPVVVAGPEIGRAEVGDGGEHLLDVVEGLGRHPGPGHGLRHQLEQRPLVMTGLAPSGRKYLENSVFLMICYYVGLVLTRPSGL